jgi:hypothetical protein
MLNNSEIEQKKSNNNWSIQKKRGKCNTNEACKLNEVQKEGGRIDEWWNLKTIVYHKIKCPLFLVTSFNIAIIELILKQCPCFIN